MADNPIVRPSKHNAIAAWVFGSIILLFYIYVFVFAPVELPEFKHKQLAIFSALLCALFTFFVVGTLRVNLQIKNKWSQLAIQSGSGAAAFVLVLWWWNNLSLAPITIPKKSTKAEVADIQNTIIKQTTTGDSSAATIANIPLDHKNVVQKTEGKNSPAIISNGNVSINSEK